MRLLAATLAVLSMLGCKDGSRPRVAADAEARAFADSLAAEVVPSCDVAKLSLRIDSREASTAARLFCQWLAGASSYTRVGLRMVDGKPRPIMRRLLDDPTTGAMFVGYDELVLAPPQGGSGPRLADAFSYRQSVWISELLAANKDGLPDGKTDFLGASSAHPGARAAQDKLRAGDREGALKDIDALAPAVRKERGVQILRLRTAVGLGPDTYKQALTELAQTFPDDPAIALIQIDGALDTSDFASAIRWIDILQKAIGIDAYLETIRVVTLIRKGDYDKALVVADAAVRLEPTLTRALETKLDVLIVRKMWPEVLATITELETSHGRSFDVDKLRAEPRLAELVASPAFAEWVATRGQ